MTPLTSAERRSTAVVICDIDGVLADASEALAAMPPGDWRWFHSQVGFMRPTDNGVVHLLRLLYHRAHVLVILVTCRPDYCLTETEEWLERYGVRYHELMMRPEGVHPTDWKRMAVATIKKRYSPTLAIDDNPAEVEMYRQAGIPAIHIDSGDWSPQSRVYTWSEEQRYG